MAYITKEEVKVIRNEIKKAYPTSKGYKFSIRGEHYSTVYITVLKSPYEFASHREGALMNSDCARRCGALETEIAFMKDLSDIANKTNHNNSDIMTDYFDVGFYCFITVGDFEKPYKQAA